MTPIGNDEIRLFLLNLDRFRGFRNEARSLLSPDERERADRFKVPHPAETFVLTRGLLRRCLGNFLREDPGALRFEYGPQGKPSLPASPAGEPPLTFNLSHSGNWAAFAFARGREVGIDLEKIRPVEDIRLAERYFSAPEAIVFQVTPPEKREEAFFHYWTAKESYIKARGDGMALGLKNYSFSDPWERPLRLTWVGWDAQEIERWTFYRFRADETCMGTLAYAGGPAEIKEFRDL